MFWRVWSIIEMDKLIIFCSGAKHLLKKFNRKNLKIGENQIEIFPDGEFNQKFSGNLNLQNKDLFLVQSFYKNEKFSINDRIFEVLSCYYNAKSLGAKKIFLIALYFPYLRQDKRFEKNQTITSKTMSELCSVFKKVFIFEPHLHRFHNFKEFFPNAKKISLNDFIIPEIKKIKKKYKRLLVIGPDEESEIWAKPIKDKVHINYVILKKKRHSPRDVSIKINKTFVLDGVIIIDDIISTGKTLLECLKKVISKKNFCFVFHGLFTDKKTLNKLKTVSQIIITNTVDVKDKDIKIIDISDKIKEIIREN